MDFIKHLIEKHHINLNEQQQKAVTNIEGPILLLAVPGGGKTTVIVSRCANMVINYKINPENILTLTFSKASALDMKHRFQKVFGNEVGTELHFSTIHSFCYTVLRTYTQKMHMPFPTIIEDEKAPITKSQLLRQIHQKRNESFLSDDKLEELSNAICYIKNMTIPDHELLKYKTGIKNFCEIYKSYEAFKQQNNYIDFDDMLTRTLELFQTNEDLINAYRSKFKYINVDESQDTSYLQHQIIKCLANPGNNIFMVGDEDQSIYTFRAAFPKALLDFEVTYPGAQVYLMENNYRSTKSIVAAANIFIKQNHERHDKNMFSEKDEGTPVKYTCLRDKNDQYEHIVSMLEKEPEFAETAVLYRNNVSAIPLADALHRSNIPFYLREAKTHFFRHWVTVDILSFMELSFDPTNIEAFRQVYYKMNAYLSKAMVEFAISNDVPNRNLFEILSEYPGLTEKQNRKLLEIKQNILKISKLKALEAIEFIVEVLDYGEYIKKQSSDGTETTDTLMQIISGLKSIAAKTESIQDFKSRLEQLQQIMDNAKFNKGKNAVTLSTIHSSKGLEFDKVFMIDLFDGQLPSANSISEAKSGEKTPMEEEVRLFYVGATRARHQLELMAANTLDGKKAKPSRFIEQFLAVYKKQTAKADNGKFEMDLGDYIDKGNITEKELFLEMPVVHRKFGIGKVRVINAKADLLEICFDKSGLRIFSLKICLDGGIIHALEHKSAGNNA
jgi:DNA helicase-2/ATP-dependent DNA helicase PcrA